MMDEEFTEENIDMNNTGKIGVTTNEYQSNTNKKQLIPIVNQIHKLEDTVTEIKRELINVQKKEIKIKTQINTMEYRNKKKLDEVLKLICDDLIAIDRDVKKLKQSDDNETEYFNQQINMLINDKTKAQQCFTNLDNRLLQCETDVGIKK